MNMEFVHDRLAQAMFARSDSAPLSEIRRKLDSLSILVTIDSAVAHQRWAQAAAMAIVACGSRMFRGGVFLGAPPTIPTVLAAAAVPLNRTLERLGARASGAPPTDAFRVHIGFDGEGFINVAVRGWTAIISPRAVERTCVPSNEIAGALAGALAASEVFRRIALGAADACRVTQEINAWEPGNRIDFDGTIKRLPQSLWLIGLGNLGQAALFLLSLLPFPDRTQVKLVLQDFDRSGLENLGTQLLTDYGWIGRRKAAAAASHMSALGFETFSIERRFGGGHGPQEDEPRIAIVGVDNAKARRSLATAGFDLVVDAGLGTTPAEIFDIAVHAFPGRHDPETLWPDEPQPMEKHLPDRFEELIEAGVIDRCGAITIAGQAVGVPSTALAAAALQLTLVCRALSTRSYCDTIELRTARSTDAASARADDHKLSLPSFIPNST